MEYYSVLKRNELLSHEKTWGKFKCILLSSCSQSERKATYTDSNSMTEKRQNYGDKMISGCWNYGEEGCIGVIVKILEQ